MGDRGSSSGPANTYPETPSARLHRSPALPEQPLIWPAVSDQSSWCDPCRPPPVGYPSLAPTPPARSARSPHRLPPCGGESRVPPDAPTAPASPGSSVRTPAHMIYICKRTVCVHQLKADLRGILHEVTQWLNQLSKSSSVALPDVEPFLTFGPRGAGGVEATDAKLPNAPATQAYGQRIEPVPNVALGSPYRLSNVSWAWLHHNPSSCCC